MPPPEGAWGAVWGCSGLLGSQHRCSKVLKETNRVPKTLPRAPETGPTRRNHDPLALLTFQSLPGHDLWTLPSDYERREALAGAARPRSISPVDVSELQGAQNSNSGGVEAAIIDTFIVFEPPAPPLGPLHFDSPGIPSKHQGLGIQAFLVNKRVFASTGVRFPISSQIDFSQD